MPRVWRCHASRFSVFYDRQFLLRRTVSWNSLRSQQRQHFQGDDNLYYDKTVRFVLQIMQLLNSNPVKTIINSELGREEKTMKQTTATSNVVKSTKRRFRLGYAAEYTQS